MKKTAIAALCILTLLMLVSCRNQNYDLKTEEAQNLYNDGKILPAIRLLDEAIEMNDYDYRAYAMRGSFYCRMGNYRQAISDYESAIKRGGKYCNYTLGKLLTEMGMTAEAKEYFHDYIKYDKNNPDAYIFLSKIYEQEGDLEKSEEIRTKGYEATGDKRLKPR